MEWTPTAVSWILENHARSNCHTQLANGHEFRRSFPYHSRSVFFSIEKKSTRDGTRTNKSSRSTLAYVLDLCYDLLTVRKPRLSVFISYVTASDARAGVTLRLLQAIVNGMLFLLHVHSAESIVSGDDIV